MNCNTVASLAVGRALAETVKASKGSSSPSAPPAPDFCQKYLQREERHRIISHFQKILGISNTIGRVIAGWISDFSCVNALLVTNLAIFFSGVSTLVLPFCTSYGAFATIALLFGFFVAAYISLTSIVLVDLLGLDNLTSAFGLLVLFRGVSSMVSYSTTFS